MWKMNWNWRKLDYRGEQVADSQGLEAEGLERIKKQIQKASKEYDQNNNQWNVDKWKRKEKIKGSIKIPSLDD